MVDGGSLAAAKRAAIANLDPKERELLEGTTTGKRCGPDCRDVLRGNRLTYPFLLLFSPWVGQEQKGPY